ncbi:MAG: YHS domain-containing (seleno)protein [Parvularculaceae bacterium]|nr:YHS domain-containing (seleno)protein [Parvularculaceae bacterium]
MRSMVFVAVLLASTSASAVEPGILPRPIENPEQPTWPLSAAGGEEIIAPGVPVEMILGGADAASGWIARAGVHQAALSGLDPVSFFETEGPKQGNPKFQTKYHGSVFYFANERHLELFMNAPEIYAPAFGGYDPEMLAAGSLLPANPQNWTVHDGRLFLSGTPTLKRKFEEHRPEVIRAAEEKWRAVDDMFEDRFFKAHQD